MQVNCLRRNGKIPLIRQNRGATASKELSVRFIEKGRCLNTASTVSLRLEDNKTMGKILSSAVELVYFAIGTLVTGLQPNDILIRDVDASVRATAPGF